MMNAHQNSPSASYMSVCLTSPCQCVQETDHTLKVSVNRKLIMFKSQCKQEMDHKTFSCLHCKCKQESVQKLNVTMSNFSYILDCSDRSTMQSNSITTTCAGKPFSFIRWWGWSICTVKSQCNTLDGLISWLAGWNRLRFVDPLGSLHGICWILRYIIR